MTYRGIGQTTFEMEPFGLIVGNPSQSPSSQCWHSGGKIAQSASVMQRPRELALPVEMTVFVADAQAYGAWSRQPAH